MGRRPDTVPLVHGCEGRYCRPRFRSLFVYFFPPHTLACFRAYESPIGIAPGFSGLARYPLQGTFVLSCNSLPSSL
jgi:hypothetical protein